MLTASELPRDADGAPIGVYRLRLGELTEGYPGANFVRGVADGVRGFDVTRLADAFGPSLRIEPADPETAEACARLLFERTGDGARAKALRALHARRGRRKKTDKDEKGTE